MKKGVFALLSLVLVSPSIAAEVPEGQLQQQITPAGVVNEVTLAGCLPGGALVKVPVRLGQKIAITSKVAAPCDSRGWTNGVGLNFYGPEGSGAYGGLAAGPNTPLGMLIGAFSHRQINGPLNWTDENQYSFKDQYIWAAQLLTSISPLALSTAGSTC